MKINKSVFEMNERERRYNNIINEANAAKDILARVAEKLEEEGYKRKSGSAMTLVYMIEEWQNRG